jgi:hypothetical protein
MKNEKEKINFNLRRKNVNIPELPRTSSYIPGLKLQYLALWVSG